MSSSQLSPLARFTTLSQTLTLTPDHNQLDAVKQLEQLYQSLLNKPSFPLRSVAPKSVFLWGNVGVGKTLIMDVFYNSLPQKNKKRLHFHRFMALIHKELELQTGHKDPLIIVAKRLYKNFQVLCLDELFITDIGDGMILYRLLEEFFKLGMVLVITSNFPINALYKDDLQPRLFDPAIQLLQAKTIPIHLNGNTDYRLQQSNPSQTYFLIEDANFDPLYSELNQSLAEPDDCISVCGRPIPVIKHSSTVAWFAFEALCYGPRSPLDYIELANRFSSLLISNIPILGGKPSDQIKARGTEDGSVQTPTGERKVFYALEDNAARRFISLIDALYDSQVNLYLSAAVPLQDLYIGEALCFEFKRTQSRLIEMQSSEYLQTGKAH